LGAFYLLLVTDLSGGYAQPYDAAKPSRKVRREEFFTSRRFSCERDASSRQGKAKPFGRTLRDPALPRRLCLRRHPRRRRREGWRNRLWLKGCMHHFL